MTDFHLQRGARPVLVSIPHDGRDVPDAIARDLTPAAAALPDTDLDVARLYEFAGDRGYTVLMARWSRYVVDLNRSPTGSPLYPGQAETGICPAGTFAGTPVYRDGCAPDAEAIAARVARYWRPYHDALSNELERLRQRHGQVLLWDGHSIRSRVPLLFEGQLPDYSFGTDGGRTCPPTVLTSLAARVKAAGATSVVDGRFRGGFITRHYARPEERVRTIQLELSQATYLDETTDAWLDGPANATARLIEVLLASAEQQLAEQ